MFSVTYLMIRDAIIRMKIVEGYYDQRWRIMCPHAIGTKRGREQALFYQFAGDSSSPLGAPGSPDNWRCMPIAGLSQVRVVDGDWHSAANHSRRNTCLDWVDVEVGY